MGTLVKTTLDGRKVEVINGFVCLDGKPESTDLVVLDEHPNRQAILKAVPRAAQDTFDGSPAAARERLRKAVWQKTIADGAE